MNKKYNTGDIVHHQKDLDTEMQVVDVGRPDGLMWVKFVDGRPGHNLIHPSHLKLL